MFSISRRLQVLCALPAVAVAIIGLAFWAEGPKRPLRVTRSSFQGRFTETIFTEAARRRGIPIEWVKINSPVEEALRNGSLDMLAGAPTTPQRQKEFHFTEQWTHIEFSLLSLD